MIKLLEIDKPSELTDDVINDKTEKFKINKVSVWNETYIKDQLKLMSRNKCCYCECRFGKGNNKFTVDHFHPKSKYPKEVVKWDNLMPACRRCNIDNKHIHDTKVNPIINPKYDDPSEYFIIYNYHFIPKNDSLKGALTCAVLGLNKTDILEERFKISNETIDSIRINYDNSKKLCDQKQCSSYEIYNLRNGVEKLLKEAQPDSDFSAVVATCILEHPYFPKLIINMKQLDIWTKEMAIMHNNAKSICLSPLNHKDRRKATREATIE